MANCISFQELVASRGALILQRDELKRKFDNIIGAISFIDNLLKSTSAPEVQTDEEEVEEEAQENVDEVSEQESEEVQEESEEESQEISEED